MTDGCLQGKRDHKKIFETLKREGHTGISLSTVKKLVAIREGKLKRGSTPKLDLAKITKAFEARDLEVLSSYFKGLETGDRLFALDELLDARLLLRNALLEARREDTKKKCAEKLRRIEEALECLYPHIPADSLKRRHIYYCPEKNKKE